MKYMGSKRRIAKQIAPFINNLNSDVYVEPFVGGFNITPFIEKPVIFASDVNSGLIELYQSLQAGWLPPELVTEKMYTDIKNNKQNYPLEIVAYVGYALSFGGKYFGGYRRDKAGDNSSENEENQSRRAYTSLLKQIESKQFKIATFTCLNYFDSVNFASSFGYKKPFVVYCDPPYFGTTGYRSKFNHNKFWEWVREVSLENYVVVSEYEAPKDFDVLWEGKIPNTLNKDGGLTATEKLFIWKRGLNV
jgi:DNA adenine methylase